MELHDSFDIELDNGFVIETGIVGFTKDGINYFGHISPIDSCGYMSPYMLNRINGKLEEIQPDKIYLYKEFAKIKEETKNDCIKMFVSAAEQEKNWAKYLFKDGSMIGLNEHLLVEYVEWITNKRMTAVGLPVQYKNHSNPLPWTQKWISGAEVQVAPQEVELSSYVIGGVKQDVTETTFSGFTL